MSKIVKKNIKVRVIDMDKDGDYVNIHTQKKIRKLL